MALPELLSTLIESLSSALDSIPTSTDVAFPEDGISLLSTKNELLLSYLQNLIFLIILKIRNLTPQPSASSPSRSHSPGSDDLAAHDDAPVVQNLVALRVYLERGVRPLESRLRYQLDKLLLAAADESARTVSGPSAANGALAPAANRTEVRASSPSSDADGDGNNDSTLSPKIDPLSHRPNPSSLSGPRRRSSPNVPSSSKQGLYRPPHITPTSLPSSAPPSSKRTSRAAAARKSATLDEFVREEMTDAPMAEPSIGAGSGLRGRAAERERERTGYEEGRLVRLPAEKGGGAAAAKKRRGGAIGAEDFLLGAGGQWDNGDLLGLDSGGGRTKKKQKVRREGSSKEEGTVIGERWERRKKMATRGKRR
ncbi:hypothetical protein MMC29_004781 [Sticta canariensis]|nr:hypothetical protein [Sticta canariensis]